jgi:acetyl-CoA carboxylase biotin carboxylase subunit
MISKLAAWAEDRPRAVARMRRALAEYVVAGIRTTLPFFRWLLEQPDFAAGRFHTTYLDELMSARGGQPFAAPDDAVQDLAAVAAAVQTLFAAESSAARGNGESRPAGRLWKGQARTEGLR